MLGVLACECELEEGTVFTGPGTAGRASGEHSRRERSQLQKELDLVRKHSSISLKRFRDIESVFKRGAFALVDANEALGKAKRDASMSLLSTSTQNDSAVQFR